MYYGYIYYFVVNKLFRNKRSVFDLACSFLLPTHSVFKTRNSQPFCGIGLWECKLKVSDPLWQYSLKALWITHHVHPSPSHASFDDLRPVDEVFANCKSRLTEVVPKSTTVFRNPRNRLINYCATCRLTVQELDADCSTSSQTVFDFWPPIGGVWHSWNKILMVSFDCRLSVESHFTCIYSHSVVNLNI